MKTNKPDNEKRIGLPRREACPCCRHKELLTVGVDQFCMACDWNTCAEYVERGLMNNLEMAYMEHFEWREPSVQPVDDHEFESLCLEDISDLARDPKLGRIA